MCPWVGSHAPSFGRQLWQLPSRMEYLSPQGVMPRRVYRTIASALWLELQGLSAWQATPSWTVYRLASHRLLPWLQVMFAMVREAAWPGSDHQPWGIAPVAGPVGRLGRPSAPDPSGVVCCLRPWAALRAHMCAVSTAPWHLFTSLHAWCVLCVPCAVYWALLAPLHRCARSVRCVACAVSWATWLLFTAVFAWWVALRVQCPGPLGSRSPVCSLDALCCICGVLGHLAPVHRCARSVCFVACAVSRAT